MTTENLETLADKLAPLLKTRLAIPDSPTPSSPPSSALELRMATLEARLKAPAHHLDTCPACQEKRNELKVEFLNRLETKLSPGLVQAMAYELGGGRLSDLLDQALAYEALAPTGQPSK